MDKKGLLLFPLSEKEKSLHLCMQGLNNSQLEHNSLTYTITK